MSPNECRRRIAQRARITRIIALEFPEVTPEDQAAMVENDIADEEYERAHDIAMSRELCEDTPCIQSCDDWGTGEGQFHGRI